ncbi:MAG TPA: hypothetical protein VJN67_01880 [Stellaceae bacterium]|nr:hypothetical protein [Stellaceae bacterium]
MTGLVIAEGWNMIGTGPKGDRDRRAWREVGMAWAVAVVLAGALLLTVPRHQVQLPTASLWSLSPAAGGHLHKKAQDAEGLADDEACSDRDYANELC